MTDDLDDDHRSAADDDLDGEVAKKFRKGYPQDNIIFSDDAVAVLWQNRNEVLRCDMTDTDALAKLLKLFFSFERVEIASFRAAVEQFKADLPAVLDLPLELQDWEPDYPLATYTDVGAEFPMPDLPDDWTDVDPVPSEMLDDEVDLAVRQLVEPWLTGSNGHADVVCVEGGVAEALGALGLRRARVVELDPAAALAWLAWAGASGGAHGRRRGAAAGRFGAWWTLAALGDLIDDWPVAPEELGQLAAELRWYRWDAHEPAMGWNLQLAVEDPAEDVAWAILARDAT